MERGLAGQVYNVGGGEPVAVRQAIETLEGISGKQLELVEVEWREGDARRTEADTARIRADTGWEPRTPFAEGLGAQWKWAADRVANR